MKLAQKIVLEGEFERVIEEDKHYYIESKKDRICVLPYTISSDGLLDKIGVVEDWNEEEDEEIHVLLNDYLKNDDKTNLVGANRILFETLGVNFTIAEQWTYLGALFNSIISESSIRIYAVNITDLDINKITLNLKDNRKFKLIDSSRVIQSDDILFLASFLRLFNYFYVQSINKD